MKEDAGVVKLVDALDSKSSGTLFRVGSIPTSGTNLINCLVDYLLLGRSTSAFCKDPSPSSLEGSVGRGLFLVWVDVFYLAMF